MYQGLCHQAYNSQVTNNNFGKGKNDQNIKNMKFKNAVVTLHLRHGEIICQVIFRGNMRRRNNTDIKFFIKIK